MTLEVAVATCSVSSLDRITRAALHLLAGARK
jgi:hypothetical protein